MMKLEIKNLQKSYGNKRALVDFSYTFSPGIYGILGANGAGKSTLMNLIADNLKRDGGSILFEGSDIIKLGAAFRARLGFMPQQQPLYPNLTVESFLCYMAKLKDIPRKQLSGELDKVLKMTNLSSERHKKLYALSGGMKHRVLLGQALLGEPDILLLDEPTAGLDPKERERLRDYICQLSQERIVLLSTHIVNDVEAAAEQILLMKEGRLLRSDSPSVLIQSLPSDYVPVLESPSLEDVYLYYLGGENHV